MEFAYESKTGWLANTASIYLPGDLTVTSNLNVNGTDVNIVNSSFPSGQSLVQITAANNGTMFAPSNTNYMLQLTGKANSVTRLVIDSFGEYLSCCCWSYGLWFC
jgi:hypothetical protein